MDGQSTTTSTGATASVTALFVDVVASTATMIRIGDDAADDLRRRLFEIYRSATELHGGTLVKTMGDGAMAVFTTSAAQAVTAATEMVGRAEELVPRSEVRIGIASGDASHEHGDWFGTPIVLASRLCDAASPNEVLVSAGTRTLVGNRGGLSFTDKRPMRLKGFDQRVPAFAIEGQGRAAPGRRVPWLVALAALVVVALVVGVLVVSRLGDRSGGTTTADPAVAPTWQEPDYEPVLEDRPCTDEEAAGDPVVRCSRLVVPIDRSDPGGAQLRLDVNGAPATGSQADAPPVVLLSSEPVSPSAIAARATAEVFQLGLRGTTASDSDLSCPEIDDSRFQWVAMGSAEANELYDQALEACHQRLVDGGVDLGQYDQLDVSDDVRDLVFALGVEQVDVVTRSYNDAVIALATVRRHPGLIRTLTLLDPLPLGVADALQQPQAAATLLDRYVDECRAQSTVCDGEPTLQQQVELNRQSLNASPQVVEVADAEGTPRQVLIDGERSIRVIRAAISDNQAMPLMASAIRSNDVSAAATYIALTIEREGIERGVLSVVNECARSPNLTEAQLKIEAERTTTWGALVDTSLPARCRAWGISSPVDLRTPVSSDVPTLVLRGWLEQPSIEQWSSALNSLSNRTDVVFPHEGVVSNQSGNGCGVDLRVQFLRDPSAPLDVEACTSQDPPIVFVQ